MSKEEFQNHIVKELSIPVDFGLVHIIRLDTFDPQLFLENTPLSSPGEQHVIITFFNGVSVSYSHELQDPSTELLILSVTEGSLDEQRRIADKFSDFLGTSTKRYNWIAVSPYNISPNRDMYVWTVNLSSAQ